MKRVNFSSDAWEQRVLRLLKAHPDTISVTDLRHVAAEKRGGVDGIWTIRHGARELEIPFLIAIAASENNEVRFEIAELHGSDTTQGAALSEVLQLIFVCSPDSHSMLTIPAHQVRELIDAKKHPKSVTQVTQRDVKGVKLSERVVIPLTDLMSLEGAVVSHPESW